MAARWTRREELLKRKELNELYVKENKSIGEVATTLHISQSTVYERLLRLGFTPARYRKIGFNNKRNDISIPNGYSGELSEFIGILLGDGHLTPTQVAVTLGNKEVGYVDHVSKLIHRIFNIEPKIVTTGQGYHAVYFGSTDVVRWLLSMGLVFNKVKSQVDAPSWIFSSSEYIKCFLRGFFDTDGSVYKLRFGIQLGFTNRSLPLLNSVRHGLSSLGYNPSNISCFRIYVTRRDDIVRFFQDVEPANVKHQNRLLMFMPEA